MDDRRIRVGLLVVGMTLSAGVACAVICLKPRQLVSVCHGPALRQPEPFVGAEPSVEVEVQLVSSLDPIPPDDFPSGKDGELQAFHAVDWSKEDSGRVLLEFGLTCGFGGPAVRVLLDTRRRIAFASAWYSSDADSRLGWENVRGAVRLVDWSLTPASFVEVDLQGDLDNRTYHLHLCHDLRP
jgi:hypothetical protein